MIHIRINRAMGFLPSLTAWVATSRISFDMARPGRIGLPNCTFGAPKEHRIPAGCDVNFPSWKFLGSNSTTKSWLIPGSRMHGFLWAILGWSLVGPCYSKMFQVILLWILPVELFERNDGPHNQDALWKASPSMRYSNNHKKSMHHYISCSQVQITNRMISSLRTIQPILVLFNSQLLSTRCESNRCWSTSWTNK